MMSGLQRIIAESAGMRRIVASLESVAACDMPVLIEGETGTGKELVADGIVALSRRRDAPYVKISTAAVPDELFESELFGHVKGSFTGALTDRRGLFEMADTGTVYLDDIDDFPIHMQAKVLRALEAHEVRHVGSDAVHCVDVRVLCSTKEDLGTLVAERRFRRDLFYRINVVTLRIPPLRERPDDILPLGRSFLGERRHLLEHPELRARLLAWDWPGNVRELRNVTDRLTVFGGDDDGLREVIASITGSSGTAVCGSCVRCVLSGRMSLADAAACFERRAIAQALERAHGNRADTAAMLRVHRNTLADKIARHGIPI